MANLIEIILAIYIVLNVIAFIVYGVDKRKAQNRSWRISESTLIKIAAVGPFGSFIGMNVFRHKTNKPKFRVVKVFAVIHLIVLAVLLALTL